MLDHKAQGGALKLSVSPKRRWRVGTAAALVALAVPLAAGPAAQAAPNAQARLASVAKKAPKRKVVAITQFKLGVSERQARKLVRAHKGRVTDRLPSIQGFAVKLPAKQARALRRHKSVLNVTLNTRVRNTIEDTSASLTSSADATTATRQPVLATNFPNTVGAAALHAQGITGAGVGVAVIDSGIAGDHADFRSADGSSRVTNVIANPGATRPGDEVGHGTHVAGIIAGNSNNRSATDPLRGTRTGIAPAADLVALKTADDQGNSTVLDVINALQFVVDHKDELNIKVVNLSVSSDTPGSYHDDPLDAAVEFAWHAGIVVVAAAGNRSNAADAVHYAPGNDPFVISVGGTDEAGTTNPSDDTVASWSSRGITQDGFAKPEIVAPGASIVAPLAMGSAFQALCPNCVVDNEYLKIGGTSMAAPMVAGAAALLLQVRPDLNPDQVKAILTRNVNKTADGAAELDISRALRADAGVANQGIKPNATVYAALVEAGLDPTRATWTKATWTSATWTKATWTKATWTKATWTGGVAAPWARATWTCAGCDAAAAQAADEEIDLTKSTWSKSTWSKSTWSRSSWSSNPEW
jgi:serine protease AprX